MQNDDKQIEVTIDPTIFPSDEAIGEYLTAHLAGGTIRRIPFTKLPQINALLREGNDPFLLAVHFRVGFEGVARLANAFLTECYGARTPEEGPYLPMNFPDYLWFAAALEKDADEQTSTFRKIIRSARKLGLAIREGFSKSA